MRPLPESLLLALDDLVEQHETLLSAHTYVRPEEIAERYAYDLLVAAYTIVVRQEELPHPELIHELINSHFPIASPWCPVYVPPPTAGLYWLAPAHAPAVHVQARWRPAKGLPWGRWRVPQAVHTTLYHPRPIKPGDRWRNI